MSQQDLADFYIKTIVEAWPLLLVMLGLALCGSLLGVWYRRTLKARLHGDPNSVDADGPQYSSSTNDPRWSNYLGPDGPARSQWNDDVTRLK